MTKIQINKERHELDLDLVEQNGYLSNNEVKLAQKGFLTHDQIDFYTKYAFKLQESTFSSESTIDN